MTLTGRLINNIYFPSPEAGKSKVKVLVELESRRPSWVKTEQDRKRWASAGLGVSKTGPPRCAGAPQDRTGQASPATVGSVTCGIGRPCLVFCRFSFSWLFPRAGILQSPYLVHVSTISHLPSETSGWQRQGPAGRATACPLGSEPTAWQGSGCPCSGGRGESG